MSPEIITFIIYIGGMLGIGYYFYKQNESTSDYFLGDRSLNPYVTALSAQASDMSGWLLMGFPGAVYAGGFNAMWIGIGLAIGTYLNWQFVGQRLRRYTEVIDAITIADFFEKRFKDNSRVLRIVTGLVILLFFTIYVSSGLVAGGKLFESLLNIDYTIAVYLSVIIVGLYTVLGGYLAVSWTDFVQGGLMFIALIIVPITVITNFGGFAEVWRAVSSVNPDLLHAGKSVTFDIGADVQWISAGSGLSFIGLISLLGWGLGYFGMPHILVRFMGIKSAKQIPRSQFVAVTWVTISLIGAVLVGIVGIVVLEPLADSEKVFLELLDKLFSPWVSGVFLAAVLAAIMSTIDSQLLVSSSALAEDLYTIFRRDAGQKELMWVSRGAVIVIILIGLIFALSGGSVLNIVSYAWAGLGASFGPAIIFSLFWKQTTKNGALAGIVTGGATVLIWKNVGALAGTGLYEIIPAFALSVLAIYFVSAAGKDPTDQVVKEFETALKPLKNE